MKVRLPAHAAIPQLDELVERERAVAAVLHFLDVAGRDAVISQADELFEFLDETLADALISKFMQLLDGQTLAHAYEFLRAERVRLRKEAPLVKPALP
jgi:hypothetical protein